MYKTRLTSIAHTVYATCNSLTCIQRATLPKKMGRKVWGAAVPFSCPGEGRAVSPSNTMSLGPRPTSVPSGIMIHHVVGHSRHGPRGSSVNRESGGAAVLLSIGETWSPSNIMYVA